MATTVRDICNMALGNLGGNLIMGLEDGTTESDLCKVNYPVSRDTILTYVDWTFARGRKRISPLAEDVVGSDFSHMFQAPSDCLVVRHISFDGSFKDVHDIQWEMEGRRIYASTATLYIKYTRAVEEPSLFSPACAQLIATELASAICVPLTGDIEREERLKKRVVFLLDAAGGADGVQSLPVRVHARTLQRARFRS
jgi:hypothetical protein